MLRIGAILLLYAVVQVKGTCPTDYHQFNGTSPCYSFKPLGAATDRVTWEEAVALCGNENPAATLASIKGLPDQVLLNAFLQPASSFGGVWIGLSDINNPGRYEWPDDSDASGHDNWAPGEPGTGLPEGQRCVQLVPDDKTPGLWSTFNCSEASTAYFFCEVPPTDSTNPVRPPCLDNTDPDYFVYDRTCFKITSSQMTEEEAKLECRTTGAEATLATVNNAYDNNAVRLLMLGAGVTSSWIGLELFQDAYRWEDVTRLVDYTNWVAMEPQPSDARACVTTDGDMWTPESCTETRTAICSIQLSDPPERPELGECPEGWGITGYDCLYYVSEAKTWDEAQQECTQMYPGASLFVPHSPLPIYWQQFDITPGTEFWLAMRRNDDNRFEMVDGSPVDYVKWAEGQPCCADTNQDCYVGTMPPQSGPFDWSGRECSAPKSFFCSFQSITSPPETGFCRDGWFQLDQKCYGYFPEEVSYYDAWVRCNEMAIGGDLAAVSTSRLQDMLTYFMKKYSKNVWIGLLDSSDNKDFFWTNGDAVFFTNWAPGQPDGYLNINQTESTSDCVMMMADPVMPGLWDDVDCAGPRLPYMCESYIDPLITPPPPPVYNCPQGFVEDFYGVCYMLMADGRSFEDALAYCENFGSSLASINDGYEQGFLQYFLSGFDNVPTSLWIGINDRDGDGGYTNTDGTPVTYVNWMDTDPAKGGTCVAAQKSNKWLQSDCSEERAAICKIPTGVPETPAPRATYCDDDWVQYEGNGLCYLINTYRLPGDVADTQFVSYAEAKQLCQTQGATLASIHSRDQSDWLYKISRVTLGRRNIWTGLHRSSDGLLHWEDDSVVNFVLWDQDEPSSSQEGTDCVSFFAGDSGQGLWSDQSCFQLNAFICQKPANEGTRPQCEPEWEFGGQNCFYMSTEMLSWEEAEASCNQKGSYLASLSQAEERLNLSALLLPRDEEYWPWIGFHRLPNDLDFSWSDGTPTNDPGGTSWSLGQPDNVDDDCAVIELTGNRQRWNDVNCGLLRPFICKKAPDSPGLPTVPTTPEPQGGCQSGGTRIGTHCYRLDTEPRSWDAARVECAKYPNGDLASIPIYAVQALFSSLLNRVQADNIWLGMTSKMASSNLVRTFHWIDGSTLTFTNWGAGQPSLPTDMDNCVKMLTDPDAPGKWYDDDCSKEYASVCKYDLDPNSQPVPPATFAPCPAGFTGAAPSCFRVDTTKRIFANAVSWCENFGGILAPIMDGYEAAYTELLMYNSDIQSAWIGLRSDTTSGTYEWVEDQWPKQYLNWAGGEPSLESGCVASVYSEGWTTNDCTTAKASICRSNQDIPPSLPPVEPGLNCPVNWYAFERECYMIGTSFASDNLVNGYFQCSTVGALPPSIHSRAVNNFIRINSINQKEGRFVWIGLVRDEGKYSWIDGSVVDYTNWEDGEDPMANDEKNCVVMVPELEGRWQRKECSEQAEVICMLFEPLPTTLPTTTLNKATTTVVTTIPPVLSTGAIVGISVGGGILVLIFLIWICYFCEKQTENRKEWEQKQRDDNIDVDYGVENVQYSRDVELRKKTEKKAGQKSSDDSASRGSSASDESDNEIKL